MRSPCHLHGFSAKSGRSVDLIKRAPEDRLKPHLAGVFLEETREYRYDIPPWINKQTLPAPTAFVDITVGVYLVPLVDVEFHPRNAGVRGSGVGS